MAGAIRITWMSVLGAALAAALLAGCGGGGGSGESKLLVGGGTSGGAATPPSGLSAAATGSTSIDLSWIDGGAREDGFRVERRTGHGTFAAIAQLTSDVLGFVDTGLQPGTTYTYRVTAFAGATDLGTTNEASATTGAAPPSCTGWDHRSGSALQDRARGTAYDAASGVLYVVGHSAGAIGGQSFGGADGFLRAYDRTGGLLWSQQIGTSSEDLAMAVAVSAAGEVYVAGFSAGAISGSNAGGYDAFVHRYAPGGGAPLWIGRYGTARDDRASAVAIDSRGMVLIGGTSSEIGVGNEQDPFVARFDPSQPGSSPTWTWLSGNGFFNENLSDLAIDPRTDDVYCIGRTQVVMPNVIGTPPNGNNTFAVGDIYVARIDASGAERWVVQVGSACGGGQGGAGMAGTGGDIPGGVAVDAAGDIYVTGFAQGEAAGPGSYMGPAPNTQRPPSQLCNAQDWTVWGDAVLFKLDDAGTLQWTKQFGTPESDWALDIAAAGGKVYVAGVTTGDMSPGGAGSSGGIDVFVSAFAATGTLEWTKQLGTSEQDWAYSIAGDGAGSIFVAGASGPDPSPDAWEPVVMRVCD
jgi:hypothetical protein